ncbi:hypothetical protein KW500_22395 [Vibrio fluvialis]|nr:hypothetical protein [Vibrio fluvialis]
MLELPYAKEIFTVSFTALFSFIISYLFFKRQEKLEKRKVFYEAASSMIIKYIDELMFALSDLSYSTKDNEDALRIALMNVVKKKQNVVESRLLLLNDKDLVNEFDLFLQVCTAYSINTGFTKPNNVPITLVTVQAHKVLKKLL